MDAPLRMFLPARHRGGDIRADHDGTASLGHLVQSSGVPLTEVGALLIAARPVAPSYRPRNGDMVRVRPVSRPQQLPPDGERFVLDVHLGSLARRMRLLGLDTAYANDADDDALVDTALAEGRVLLTKDRGLLHRRTLCHAAYVQGSNADQQLADVLDRFEPRLSPLTRCATCNAGLRPVPKADVLPLLEHGTARSYEEFARCSGCGRVYWRGAHARRLDAVVAAARRRSAGSYAGRAPQARRAGVAAGGEENPR